MSGSKMINQSGSSLLIKNAGLNFFTQIVLLLLFMVTTPIVVHGLGDEAYGILSLVLILVGYFGFLDLGMSQATVKFLSEYLARDEKAQAYQVVSTSIFINLILGICGGILIALFTPIFLERLFKVPYLLQVQARIAFYIFAIGFPAILIQGTLQAVPSAFQRFDLINLINGISGGIQGLSTMALVLLGFGLKAVVIAFLTVRVFSALLYLFVLFKLLPSIQLRPKWHRPTFIKLIHFGGWILVSALLSPIMVNFDRILIGSLLSVAAVTYYAVPYGLVNKLGIIHGSTVPVLFPAFSGRSTLLDKSSIQSLFNRSIKLLILMLLPFTLVISIFAEEILELWIGVDFAQKSAIVVQILVFAILVNGLATIPYLAIQGSGRPDITAKLHLIELPFYILLCLILIPILGINGVALAWGIRVIVDAILLFWAVKKFVGVRLKEVISIGLVRMLLLGLIFGFMMLSIRLITNNLLTQGLLILAILSFYAIFLWLYAFDRADREAFLKVKAGFLKKDVITYQQY